MQRLLGILTVLAVLGLPAAAGAAGRTATDTTARVCCPSRPSGELENFGFYVFKGTVTPSRGGQLVRFSYKRPKADEWRPFKVAGPGGADGTGFYVLDRKRPADKVGREGRFSVEFTPSVAKGRWLLRAVFPAQDGFARSADVVRVEVSGGH